MPLYNPFSGRAIGSRAPEPEIVPILTPTISIVPANIMPERKARGASVISKSRVDEGPLTQELVKAVSALLGANQYIQDHLGCIIPFYDPFRVLAVCRANGYHTAALGLKVASTVGQGFTCSPALMQHLKMANEKETFQQFLEKWSDDYETYGNAYVELRRGDGTAAFFHTPTLKTRVRPNHNGTLSYCRYDYAFRSDSIALSYQFHPEFTWGSTNGIHSLHAISKRGDVFYGDPEYFSVEPQLMLNISVVDMAAAFFLNAALPDMAIILTGAGLTTDDRADLTSNISTTFKGTANSHKTLLLDFDNPDVKVQIEKLNAEAKQASFRELKQDNRDEVVAAHRTPPRLLGIVSAGNLGGTGEAEAQIKIFKLFFVNPRQRAIQNYWRMIFAMCELPDPDSFTLNEVDILAGVSEIKPADIPAEMQAQQAQYLASQNQWQTAKSAETIVRDLKEIRKAISFD
jgi:hypothetical protein